MLTMTSIVTIDFHSYYNIIDYIPYAVLLIPVTYIFYKWKLLPLNPFLFCLYPNTPPLQQPLVCI